MAKVWFEQRDIITFHDPLAAATLFDERLCTFEPGQVSVELNSERLKGLTFWEPDGANAPHEVALAVNPERFFEHYFSVFE
jgi:inosine-uridine nucleoside N-ribohydrolase